jgi:prepilin-type N-terminal cleavage/methylation domain-containing protein
MRSGFTLVETLVVIAVIVTISGIMLVNYRGGEKQFALVRSSYMVASDLRRAQNMAMNVTIFNNQTPAGYGINFNTASPYSYILFADLNNDQIYQSNEKIETITLEKNIKISGLSADNLDIVFLPPDPTTKITPDFSPAIITLQKENGLCPQDCKEIRIWNSGLIEHD